MNHIDALTAALDDSVRVNREELLVKENLIEQLITYREGLLVLRQENFLQLKACSNGLLSQGQLRTLVSAFRESLVRQESLLKELSSVALPSNAWRPSKDDSSVSEVKHTLNLRRIKQTNGKSEILVRIKKTWIGNLYVNHLKSIPSARVLTFWIWKTFYPIYVSYHGSAAVKQWRPLVTFGDYVKTQHLPSTKVFDAARVDTPLPKVFPEEDQAYLVPTHDHYVFPPVYVAEVGEALIYGGTNLVFAQDAVICHDLYDFERDYTSEELHGRHVIDVKKMRMRLLLDDSTPVKIDNAASFVDACASNYAHWLTEVLPRIAAFCTIEQYRSVPIIVNDGLHHNIMESLALIVGPDREVIKLPVGRAIQVDRLCVTSVTGYVPFERRDAKQKNHSHGLFCPQAFQLLRDRFSSVTDALSQQDLPSKIYLRRTSGARNVTNRVEIEQILIKKGYVAVEPEKLTFLEQFSLFANANDVIGSSGAALANLVFCGSKTKIDIMIGRLEGTSYWYWQNMAASVSNNIVYFFGDVQSDINGIHSDFYVDFKEFNFNGDVL